MMMLTINRPCINVIIMSNNNPRSDASSSYLSRLKSSDLKSLKVAIRRHNIPAPEATTPLLRSLDDPSLLTVHYRPDEGLRPIFDRDDVIVNQREKVNEERVILTSTKRTQTSPSTSRSRSPLTDSRRNKKRQTPPRRSSPKREPPKTKYKEDYYKCSGNRSGRSRSKSPAQSRARTKSGAPSAAPSTSKSRRYSRSPHNYGDVKRRKSRSLSPPRRDREISRSPRPSKDRRRYYSRSPVKYRPPLPSDRRRSKSPAPSTSRRSRSRSPYRERRHSSRSPRRTSSAHDYQKYDGSSRHHSRSPGRIYRRYSPDRRVSRRGSRSPPPKRDERSYVEAPLIPEIQYYEGDEFWIPGPLQPSYIPGRFVPPRGAFPRGIPGPVLMPPHRYDRHDRCHGAATFWPRYPIYKSKLLRPPEVGTTVAVVSTTSSVGGSSSMGSGTASTSETVTTTSTATVATANRSYSV